MKRTIATPSLVLVAVLLLGFAAVPGADDQPAQDPEDRWMQQLEEQGGPSHASGGRTELGPVILGNPTQAAVALRIGLYYSYTPTGAFSEFFTLHHPLVQVSNTVGAVGVLDRATGKRIGTLEPGEVYTVVLDASRYAVTGSDGTAGSVAGPVFFSPSSPENLLRVESIERTNVLASGRVRPLYRGALEVARGPATLAGRVNLVNVIELEDYVRGVVVNESPAFFHVEALKAQATAARGYAVANIGRFVGSGFPFDIVDSASSQVYRGVAAEHANAIAATEGTRGLVASYQGGIISALYSSSFGGYSESNEWIFNSPSSELPGSNALPYLRSIYDGEPPVFDMNNLSDREFFWSQNQSQTYDDCVDVRNRFARWRLTIPASVIKARLPGRVVPTSADLTGDITAVSVTQRMPLSARIARVEVTLTTSTVEVRGWDNLRRVFGATSGVTPDCRGGTIANNFVLNNPTLLDAFTDGGGAFAGVVATGGGWGHNVGLSQFGAHGRGLSGQNFLEILNTYYTGVDIGSYPIDIGRTPVAGPPTLRQLFVSPTGQGTLEVRAQGMDGLRVHINDNYDLALSAADLAEPVVRIDVTPYLVTGANVVQYNPVGQNGTATVLVIVD
jgi:SpoIID/LytB domain protein